MHTSYLVRQATPGIEEQGVRGLYGIREELAARHHTTPRRALAGRHRGRSSPLLAARRHTTKSSRWPASPVLSSPILSSPRYERSLWNRGMSFLLLAAPRHEERLLAGRHQGRSSPLLSSLLIATPRQSVRSAGLSSPRQSPVWQVYVVVLGDGKFMWWCWETERM